MPVSLRSLDWDRLKVFQAVAESGSISAAAAILAVSHAKVSRDIEELEHSCGAELFVRSTRGMQVTTIGADVLKSVRNMADSAQAISNRVEQTDEVAEIVIATQDGMATYWLANKLPEFLQSHPDIHVTLKVTPDTPHLADGDGDIAIQYEPPSSPSLIARQLGWLHYILYASPAYLSVFGAPESMFDLGKHRFLMLTGYTKQREAWTSKTPQWIEILGRALQSNSTTVLVESCANGAGILPLPTWFSEIEPRLHPLTNIKPLANARFWLVYTERVREQNRFAPVLDWLRDSFDPSVHECFRETYVPPKPPTPIEGQSAGPCPLPQIR